VGRDLEALAAASNERSGNLGEIGGGRGLFAARQTNVSPRFTKNCKLERNETDTCTTA
jgi:hypothetical protein